MRRVSKSARFTLLCLSEAYLAAIGSPIASAGGTMLYLASPATKLGPRDILVPAGRVEARLFRVSEREARAVVLAQLSREVAANGLVVLEVLANRQASSEQGT
jgi:hypothetical protein